MASEEDRILKLCFSVDLINSTRSKQFKINNTFVWPSFFKGFYESFQKRIHEIKELEKVKLWKANGDELLFYCDLDENTLSQTGHLISTFLKAVDESRKSIAKICNQVNRLEIDRNKKENIVSFNLDLKCTVWCAPVPYRNIPIGVYDISKENNKAIESDIIGPEIDLGFRLSSRSSSSDTPICPITALVLAKFKNHSLDLLFNGFHDFKGITPKIPVYIIASSTKEDYGFGKVDKKNLYDHLKVFVKKEYPNLVIPGLDNKDFKPGKKNAKIKMDQKDMDEINKITNRHFKLNTKRQ